MHFSSSLVAEDKAPIQDHCGILALIAPIDSPLFTTGLTAFKTLQTRGYDGAGFWAIDSTGKEYGFKGTGMIDAVFTPARVRKFSKIKARIWLFQNRYGTSGNFDPRNVQPFRREHFQKQEIFCLAHNGQFSKRKETDYLEQSDTATFADELSNQEGNNWDERLLNLLQKYTGAYSLIMATQSEIFCARDALGIRPFVFGKLTKNPPFTWIVASETAALKAIDAVNYKEILPGTLLKFSAPKSATHDPICVQTVTTQKQRAYCIFENVYLMDESTQAHAPTTETREIRNHQSINLVRFTTGRIMAREAPLSRKQVDFVCGIPGTGIVGGQGYANALMLPYVQAIADRTTPNKEQRTFMSADVEGIFQKMYDHFEIASDMFKGRNVVLIDDSLVRGNVTKGLIKLLRNECGVSKVHIRILCPPVDKPCYLGINTRNANELLAHKYHGNIRSMQRYIGADSLVFLSSEGLREAITTNPKAKGFCMGCMQGYKPPITLYGKRQKTLV
ncbi:MAG: amidophosphoribosyltransferase [Patescibacteria group bacterium]|nr:MAG: amidophosphoribosyltransferase [Patescibacteria group bacterium]